jgi:hypothetical protein
LGGFHGRESEEQSRARGTGGGTVDSSEAGSVFAGAGRNRECRGRGAGGMVEFMPISEMAKMAEALVNLTSIKRRVSRGMETVGGPIDVAVISRSDGFVWVRCKHYFPPELNNRYFERIRSKVGQNRESDDDKDLQSGDAGA